MTEKQFWMRLDQLSSRKEGWMLKLTMLLRQAYEEDLDILIGCHHDTAEDIRQLYITMGDDTERKGARYLLCYTSKDAARSDPALTEPFEKIALRRVVDNALGKASIGGLVFNHHLPEKMYAIPKQFLGDEETLQKALQKLAEHPSTDPYFFADL